MRINLPVTQKAYPFPSGQTLVSVTDLKGHIVYCNPAFMEISGYSSAELLGQAHNIVRHPDMPEEAFRDMWHTIQAQLPWTGLVKNRRKNGDHYWVLANATPMLDGQRTTGYLSVRTCPSAQAIADAERLYARMRAEEQSGKRSITLHRGQVIKTGLGGRLQRLFNVGGIASKLVLAQLMLGGVVLTGVMLGLPLPIIALIIAMTAGISFWLAWAQCLRPLGALIADANHLAACDLSHAVTTGAQGPIGQLQQALNQMSVNLRTVVGDVRAEIDQLGIAIQEISDGNQNLSARTESQASSLEQTAASMEQINSSAQLSATSAQRGYQLAATAKDVTGRSNDAVRSVAQSMGGIADSSTHISDIINVIEGVAFQTNILALNAAVEAARAGEQGRGFAVVAAEVRALAHRTTVAAKEIKQLITESSGRIATGHTRTATALERMDSALSAVGHLGTVLEEISSVSTDQTQGIAQVNEAIMQIDSITQQNAAMVEELAATAQSLHRQVTEVGNSMRLFRLQRGDKTVDQIDAQALRRARAVPSLN